MKKTILTFSFVFLLTGCSLMPGVEKQVQHDENVKEPVEVSEKEEVVNESEVVEDEDGEEKFVFGNNNIKVFGIESGDNITSPVVIEGEGIAFENNLIVELRNNDHKALVKEHVTIKSSDIGESGPFKITLHFVFSGTKEGFVAVYEESAKDGSELSLVEIPVKFKISETQN